MNAENSKDKAGVDTSLEKLVWKLDNCFQNWNNENAESLTNSYNEMNLDDMDWSGIETKLGLWEAGDEPPELWQNRFSPERRIA